MFGQGAQVLKMKIMNASKLRVKYLSKSGVRKEKRLGQSYLGGVRGKEIGKLRKRKHHKVGNFFGYADSHNHISTSPCSYRALSSEMNGSKSIHKPS